MIPITRMDQDYDYMPLTFEEFDDYADKVKKGLILKMEKRAIDNSDNIIINCEGYSHTTLMLVGVRESTV